MKPNALINIVEGTGKSKADIAEAVGVSPQMFNWMIRNPKRLRWEQVEAIAKALKKSPVFISRHL